MFRHSSMEEFEKGSEGGTRYLFGLDHFDFLDAMDDEEELHHYIVEAGDEDEDPAVYETDGSTMYECMARFLAGEYEKKEYDLDRSPAQDALLDLLELAGARARSGESDFALEDLEEEEESETEMK